MSVAADRQAADLNERIGRIMEGRVPGLSVALVHPERPPWVAGFGLADVKLGTPAAADTVYLWFSMTKIVTATAVMQLVDRRALRLQHPIDKYVPEFARMVPPDVAARATVRNLLDHTAGLVNPIPLKWVHLESEPGPDPHAFAAGLLSRHRRLRRRPNTRSRYSNIG